MTDSIPLDALPGSADDDTRRDGYGRYLIVPPAGASPSATPVRRPSPRCSTPAAGSLRGRRR